MRRRRLVTLPTRLLCGLRARANAQRRHSFRSLCPNYAQQKGTDRSSKGVADTAENRFRPRGPLIRPSESFSAFRMCWRSMETRLVSSLFSGLA